MALEDRDGAASAPWARAAQADHGGLAIERMPGLAYALEQFALNAPEEMAPLFKAHASGQVDAVESSSLFDLLGKREGLIAAALRCEQFDARLLLVFERSMVDTVVCAVFGDDAQGAARRRLERPPTGIETALIAQLCRHLTTALDKGFAPAAALGLSFERLQTIADVYALGRRDMPAVAARVTIETAAGPMPVTVLMPQSVLAPMRKALSFDPNGDVATADPRWTRQLEVGVSKARVAVTAVLDEVEMTLGDVAELTVGKVLSLENVGAGRVRLECAGREMFWCRLAQGEEHYSLEIEEPIEPEAEAVEAAALC
jgi:flagellar motor switch protein FliM